MYHMPTNPEEFARVLMAVDFRKERAGVGMLQVHLLSPTLHVATWASHGLPHNHGESFAYTTELLGEPLELKG